MTTRDMFLDALAVSPSAVRAVRMDEQRRTARSIHEQASALAAPPMRPIPSAPSIPADPVALTSEAPRGERPAFADDIDQLVLDMVAKGDVVMDVDADAYRAPHCRRFRFAGAAAALLGVMLLSGTARAGEVDEVTRQIGLDILRTRMIELRSEQLREIDRDPPGYFWIGYTVRVG